MNDELVDLTRILALSKEFASDFNRHVHGMIPPPMTDQDRLSAAVRSMLRLGVTRCDIHRMVDEACVSDVMDS